MLADTKAAISFSVNPPIHQNNVNISNVSVIINVREKSSYILSMHIFSNGKRLE